MGAAPSKVDDTGDVESKERADSPDFTSTSSEKYVENPLFVPTPSDKQEAYEAIIESLQRDLHVAHERAEVALNDWSILDAEVEKLRSEKNDATWHINFATKAAKLSREKSIALETEVEKLRAERVQYTRQLYQSDKQPGTVKNEELGGETTLNDACRAGAIPVAEHQAVLKAKDQKIEELEGICNKLRKMVLNDVHLNLQKENAQLAKDQTTQSQEVESVSEIVKKLVNDHTKHCDECMDILNLYMKLLTSNKSLLDEYQELRQTAIETSALNKKGADLMDQQAETISRLEKVPKAYWVFEEKRFWNHSDWKLRPVKPDNCGGP